MSNGTQRSGSSYGQAEGAYPSKGVAEQRDKYSVFGRMLGKSAYNVDSHVHFSMHKDGGEAREILHVKVCDGNVIISDYEIDLLTGRRVEAANGYFDWID